jgi:hypothetical protein
MTHSKLTIKSSEIKSELCYSFGLHHDSGFRMLNKYLALHCKFIKQSRHSLPPFTAQISLYVGAAIFRLMETKRERAENAHSCSATFEQHRTLQVRPIWANFFPKCAFSQGFIASLFKKGFIYLFISAINKQMCRCRHLQLYRFPENREIIDQLD